MNFILLTTGLEKSTDVLIILLLVLGILASMYFIVTLRSVNIAVKKIDYFYEDLAYKAESLNSTVEAVARATNYVEIFEAFSKRNVKSWVKVTIRNKDVFYKLFDKVKDFANSEE